MGLGRGPNLSTFPGIHCNHGLGFVFSFRLWDGTRCNSFVVSSARCFCVLICSNPTTNARSACQRAERSKSQEEATSSNSKANQIKRSRNRWRRKTIQQEKTTQQSSNKQQQHRNHWLHSADKQSWQRLINNCQRAIYCL